MSDVNKRNAVIYKILTDFLERTGKYNFLPPFSIEEVEILFNTSIWGHREIVLTIILARLFDPKFKASKNFYSCNPRSIFEKPIRKALREYGVPHRKSGPLNVAKNTEKINKDWAANKHEEKIAMTVVGLVKKIEAVPYAELGKFALAYVARYKQEAKRIKEMEIKLEPKENPIFISKLCIDLVNSVPDGGAIPQMISGLLMEVKNQDRKCAVEVIGHLDSVSATNTTSKKPGDIVEKITGDSELIYEVTTKGFTDDRLIESHESVMVYDKNIKDVFVICRPKDIPETLTTASNSYIMATTQYKELAYYFINIYDFIQSSLLFLTPKSRRLFYSKLVDYVNETNTSEKVKKFFKQWHTENLL
ncbi:MAG: hypothetical protein WC848_02495 [Parcubacteria group bacterium]|jgi:hypothetical protein